MLNIILIHRRLRKPLTLQIQPKTLGFLLVPLVVLPLLGAAVTWLWMHHRPVPSVATTQHSDPGAQLQVLSQRMADIQAHILRLDALGQHLAESNNLRSKEFDFSHKPPAGGPVTPSLDFISQATLIQARLNSLAHEIDDRDSQLNAMEQILRGRRDDSPHLVLGNSPLRHGEETSPFGYRVDPITGKLSFHPGIDFGGSEGEGIYATGSGVVTWAGPRTGYGNMVEINHGHGLLTHYAHCSLILVHVGDTVSAGQLVARMGNTGRSTGTHLHYEVIEHGVPVNPATFLAIK